MEIILLNYNKIVASYKIILEVKFKFSIAIFSFWSNKIKFYLF